MNPFSAALKVWFVVKNIPWLWRLIANWQEVKKLTDACWQVYISSREAGGLPTCATFDEMIFALEGIFRKRLVDIPDVDELVVAEEIKAMRHLLTCSIENERKRLGLDGK